MNKITKLTSLLLVTVFCLGLLTGCGGTKTETKAEPQTETQTETKTDAPAETKTEPPTETKTGTETKIETPLVVGESPFNEKFSPFFAETLYDTNVVNMTQINLLNNDRQGSMIYNGIKGETIPYNGTDYTYTGPADCVVTENEDGTVTYDFTLREDLKFSDGTPLTVNDIIFSMYVECDPTYDGTSTLYAVPIEGMEEYRTGMEQRGAVIFHAGEDGYKANDLYTEEQYNTFWEYYNNNAGVDFAREICDYCVSNGFNTDGDSVAVCAASWGYELAEEATYADFWSAIVAAYDSVDEAVATETAGHDLLALTVNALGDAYQAGVITGDTAAGIKGIRKIDDYHMTVTTTRVDATAIYQLSVAITPLHYYGDSALFDYDNNSFGFVKGDLSLVRSKTTQPMGAGPYKFLSYKDGVVYFEANSEYFKGAPKTKYISFQECMTDDDKLNGVITGTIDVTEPSFSNEVIKAIESTNGGELSGSKIKTDTVDQLGYGYIGMCAKVMNVGGEPGSEASRNLRKAFATLLSVYRDVSVDTYYGDRASVINYPISNTSWAAPQPMDEGYRLAFSTDVNGNDIYTSDMTAEQRYAAAQKAALEFLEAAGYTVSDGKVTAAPKGASLSYEMWIPGDGTGDHPCFMIATEASKAFADIGITLKIRDLTNGSELWTGLEAQQIAIWAAAWNAMIDPDMYQIYYSDVANGGVNAGGSNYHYAVADEELDAMILDARLSTDQAFRKQIYRACLETVMDWAVEIPVYQRQNAVIFSAERVDLDTVTPDITPFYKWTNEIEKTVLK